MSSLMNDTVYVDKRIDMVAVFGNREHLCTPVRFRYQNREVTISEIGLVHPTVHGKRMVHVFDVTDGVADYRLEFDAEKLTWRLVYVADRHLP